MSQFRIMDFNWPFDPTVTLSASSEDSEFPVSNLSSHLRSDVWRSSGYFVITSSNSKINFKEDSGGSEITVTIASGAYSANDLASQIQTLLTAATTIDATYTVSFSTGTGKWQIQSSGAYLSLLWNTGTDTANSIGPTIGFSTTVDSTGATTYLGHFAAIHTEERVVIDLGTWTGQSIDSFALLFGLDGVKLTENATLTLQANQTNEWSSPALTQSLSIDETFDVITHFFSSSQTYRYWSVKVVDPQNPYGYVEIPKIILSLATQLSQLPNRGFSETNVDRSSLLKTDYGQTYVNQYPATRAFKFEYTVLPESDVLTLQGIHRRVGSMVPIAIALDPTATTFDKDRFFLYGRIQGELEILNTHYTYFDTAFSIAEEL